MSNKNKNNLTVFLDSVGRTIICKVEKETETTLSVSNPALVHVQANPETNQLQLQLLPLFFKEFLTNREETTVWHYQKSNITMTDELGFAPQFAQQYEQLFQAVQRQQPPAEPEVVKLFDEN
jgi:hypothetical protein